jgi:hypothetical protein
VCQYAEVKYVSVSGRKEYENVRKSSPDLCFGTPPPPFCQAHLLDKLLSCHIQCMFCRTVTGSVSNTKLFANCQEHRVG